MNDEVISSRVEIHLARKPPAARVARAAGVSEVKVSGTVLTCLVCGIFQPLLESLQGYEVVCLWSSPAGSSRSLGMGEDRSPAPLE
ncbi:hypothetical protein [Georgenia yuyongxinii]|uniref:Uncharacterized protein n=1 Tax=Georgenia yuyongxinii TaxID=2589797 RepID=A0A552WVH7_9MICO|nr:hypothetical protein [Georgenia yuyongxinii]TRW46715.1 hypothetical protein FJ693_04280 [Georgenia yuyongxinii]